MKLVSWNCNRAFRKKILYLEDIDFDIAVIQECERDIKNLPCEWKRIWIGNNKNKGLSVISKRYEIEIDNSYDPNWSYFLPININKGELFLIAVWAYNHRALKQFGNEAFGYPQDVF